MVAWLPRYLWPPASQVQAHASSACPKTATLLGRKACHGSIATHPSATQLDVVMNPLAEGLDLRVASGDAPLVAHECTPGAKRSVRGGERVPFRGQGSRSKAACCCMLAEREPCPVGLLLPWHSKCMPIARQLAAGLPCSSEFCAAGRLPCHNICNVGGAQPGRMRRRTCRPSSSTALHQPQGP